MNMVIKSVNLSSKKEIYKFLEIAGSSLLKFRYFDTRDADVLQNHLLTLLGYEENKPVVYGHLDTEDEKLWLGICVAGNYKGRGMGKEIMHNLVKEFNNQDRYDSLHLSVDRDNHAAISLYDKFGFSIIKENEFHYIMRLDR
tara:strand:- start:15854 stop:16279 length:426 start_codon:yes stop_codon:yes gene_type:complete